MRDSVVSVGRTVPAPPERVFDLLADAAKHPQIDGSGTLRATKLPRRQQLELGSVFGMSMHVGFGYSMVNTVIEYEEGRRIAWQSYPAGPAGKVLGGRIWRYELEPVEGGTCVTESWDMSRDRQRRLLVFALAGRTQRNMEATLARIADLVMDAPTAGRGRRPTSRPDAEGREGRRGIGEDR